MSTQTLTRQQLIETINELPPEILPELANFVAYLQFKANLPDQLLPHASVQLEAGSTFLLAIAGLGESDEIDLSERDEEVLAQEIDPIRGWSHQQDNGS